MSVFGNDRISTHAYPMSTHRSLSSVRKPKGNRCACREGGGGVACWQISPILGSLGSKVPQIVAFPASDADKLPCKIWRH